MKTVLIILDGLSDKPIKKFNNKTPLESAKTPNLDYLASNGVCGLIEPFYFPWQKYPRSDTAHLALFGYDPKTYYLGRGVYEAIGENIKMKKGDVALRANFATVDKNLKILDRRAGRINNTGALIKAISGIKIKGIKFSVAESLGHRAVLVLKGKGLSSNIGGGDTDKNIGIKAKNIIALNKSKKAKFTAEVLNEFLKQAHDILKNHPLNKKRKKQGLLPANYLLVRGAGEFRKTPSFYEKHKLKAGCIAAGHVYKGIAKILGMDLINVQRTTGDVDTNLFGKISSIKKNIKKYDFIFCHIKTADILSENGDCFGKMKFIERIDKSIKSLLNIKDIRIVITADHSTCCETKKHCTELIPVLIYKHQESKKRKIKFSEKSCKNGKLKKFKQIKLMSKILKK
ncbi:MAG: 2,3-bisphosphoglycerate-independent phosphoglycerate mutase [Patescibacteria group bacterium]|nr:2,3-bisphosphoglycerate-independent phosphoglycerate mutase [Patescibacteria group bacterium]